MLLDGFDPLVHIEVPDIVGFPGYKSNEPKQLEAAGIPFKLYDPSDYDIPGSFGVLYTNLTFLAEHPTAAQDFMRATMRGLADAIADPAAAAAGRGRRHQRQRQRAVPVARGRDGPLGRRVASWSPTASPPTPRSGLPLIDQLTDEVTAYAEIGLFDGVAARHRHHGRRRRCSTASTTTPAPSSGRRLDRCRTHPLVATAQRQHGAGVVDVVLQLTDRAHRCRRTCARCAGSG